LESNPDLCLSNSEFFPPSDLTSPLPKCFPQILRVDYGLHFQKDTENPYLAIIKEDMSADLHSTGRKPNGVKWYRLHPTSALKARTPFLS
jgi:hypothetical protein